MRVVVSPPRLSLSSALLPADLQQYRFSHAEKVAGRALKLCRLH